MVGSAFAAFHLAQRPNEQGQMIGNACLLAEVAEQAVERARRHAKFGADLFVRFSTGEGAKNNCFLEGE